MAKKKKICERCGVVLRPVHNGFGNAIMPRKYCPDCQVEVERIRRNNNCARRKGLNTAHCIDCNCRIPVTSPMFLCRSCTFKREERETHNREIMDAGPNGLCKKSYRERMAVKRNPPTPAEIRANVDKLIKSVETRKRMIREKAAELEIGRRRKKAESAHIVDNTPMFHKTVVNEEGTLMDVEVRGSGNFYCRNKL